MKFKHITKNAGCLVEKILQKVVWTNLRVSVVQLLLDPPDLVPPVDELHRRVVSVHVVAGLVNLESFEHFLFEICNNKT